MTVFIFSMGPFKNYVTLRGEGVWNRDVNETKNNETETSEVKCIKERDAGEA